MGFSPFSLFKSLVPHQATYQQSDLAATKPSQQHLIKPEKWRVGPCLIEVSLIRGKYTYDSNPTHSDEI